MTDTTVKPMDHVLQIVLLISITIGFMLLGGLIAIGVILICFGPNSLKAVTNFDASAPHFFVSFWALQLLSTTIPMFVSPVIFARYVVKQPMAYLKADITKYKQKPGWWMALFVIVLALTFAGNPLIEFLANLNAKMTFTGFLKAVGDFLKEKEGEAAKMTEILLAMKTYGALAFNLFAVGLLTAIAEEFLFRGCIQTIFTRWTRNPHIAIFITAALFSAIHMEFFSFLPRFLLGIFFGYFVLWTGSIWTSIWAHFLNNGLAVLLTFLYQHHISKNNPDGMNVYNYKEYAMSLVFTLFLLWIYRYIALNKKQLPAN